MKLLDWIKLSFLTSCFALTACGMQFPEDGIPVNKAKTSSSSALVILPVAPDERTIQLNVRGPASSALKSLLTNEFEKKGYHVQSDAKKASYVMMVRVLYQGSGNEDAVDDILLQGYDAPVWPAGAIAVGKERYIKTAGRSRAAYMMVLDLTLKYQQEVYQTRLVSYYPNWMGQARENKANSALNQSITGYIVSIF